MSSFGERYGVLARLPNVEATIAYDDAAGCRTERRVAFHCLSGSRDPDGDTIKYADAWCFLRKDARTFRLDRIASLIPAGDAEPVASPEGWFRERARGQVRSAPPHREPAPVPAEELFALYAGLEFDALIQTYYPYDGKIWPPRTESLRFQVHEIWTLRTGGVREIRGTDLVTGERRAIHIDHISLVADPRTGEIAGARRQWLKDMAEGSLNAGYGRKVFEPDRSRPRKPKSLADLMARTKPVEPDRSSTRQPKPMPDDMVQHLTGLGWLKPGKT